MTVCSNELPRCKQRGIILKYISYIAGLSQFSFKESAISFLKSICPGEVNSGIRGFSRFQPASPVTGHQDESGIRKSGIRVENRLHKSLNLNFNPKAFILLIFSLAIIPEISFGNILSNDTIISDSISIDKIIVIGNRVTKEKIIRRELDFKEGDIYNRKVFESMLKLDEEKLINTSLFLKVNISILDLDDRKVDIIIRLIERWYLFPIPILELADRNFNDWWVNQHHDLSRFEWGMRLTQYNVRGRNETLNLTGLFGFTKKLGIAYAFPYLNRKQKLGMNLYFDYGLNKNLNYNAVDNKLLFLKSDHWLKEHYTGGISFTLRKSFFVYHTFGGGYVYNKINDTIQVLNPRYFYNNSQRQQFLRIYYYFLYDKRDIAAYPLHGFYFRSEIEKYGFLPTEDVNIFLVSALYYKYFQLPWKTYLNIGIGGRLTFPEKQPYNLFNSSGYAPFTLRGYELYVIQGQHVIQNKWTLSKLLYKKETDLSDYFSIRQLQHFNIAIYLKTFADFGYVKSYDNNEQNSLLTDQLLYGYGGGIDIVTIYDLVYSFEYSFNKLNENGFVFSIRKKF